MTVESSETALPGTVVTPSTAEDLASALAAASSAGHQVVIRGGGTKIDWGRVPERVDLVVSTARLNRVLAHRHGDLTATIEAGATLADANRELARHGQWLPLESAFDAATVGGIVATNDCGPARHRFGTPRDLLIGVTLALTDGRLIKAGGTVVKNVAGYDLGRLMSGSFGSFAAIVTATFKLSPLPSASGTLGVVYGDAATLATDAQVLASNQFEMTTCDVRVTLGAGSADHRLLICFASSPAATEAQLAAAQRLLRGDGTVVRGAAEGELWRTQVESPWTSGATLRLAWLPASLGDLLALLDEAARVSGAVLAFTGRAAVGAGFVRIDGSDQAVLTVVERLRHRAAVAGNVVVLRASDTVKRQIDVWGEPTGAAPVLAAIKKTLDPAGILNAGRGPV